MQFNLETNSALIGIMMESFFFGSGNQQLFGSYHPPTSGDGQVLTVICPPLFSELARTHSALRKLAISLADAGRHVLRFDYRGTGDSMGELGEITIADWLKDIELAVREGRDISGCSDVHILAVRAASLLACAAMETERALQKLVLWDPLADGAGYIQALRSAQARSLRGDYKLSRSERREGMRDIAGWRASERMLDEFRSLDAGVYARVPQDRLRVVNTVAAGPLLPPGVAAEVVPFPCNWGQLGENVINPQPVLERLFACLMQP